MGEHHALFIEFYLKKNMNGTFWTSRRRFFNGLHIHRVVAPSRSLVP